MNCEDGIFSRYSVGNLADGLPVLLAAVAALNRLELVGESVRAALET